MVLLHLSAVSYVFTSEMIIRTYYLHGVKTSVSLLSEKAFISSNGSMPSPLLYSVQYALRHASVVTEAGITHPRTLYDDLRRLLDKDSPRFQLWKSSLPLYWRDFDIHHTTPLFLLDESARQLLDPLHIMASYGFFDLLREELNSRLDVIVLDGHGRTPLSWAAFGGREKLVELLLARGGADSISMADNHDLSPLSLAAWNGHAKVVKVLLAQDGIDVNHVDESTETPLLKAAVYGHQEVVQLLLSCDDINANAVDSDGRTPLLRAATNGSKEVVELLLAHDGVDISKASNIGETPLWAAAAGGHKEVLELLIGQGNMDINTTNDEGETGLFRAASIGSKDVVELLLTQDGVDVNKDYEGRTLSGQLPPKAGRKSSVCCYVKMA